MLQITPEKIAEPLQIIFNKSLRQVKYPSTWNIVHVIAILKKGDASLPSNYRPISLISFVGKIMERVGYKNVYRSILTLKNTPQTVLFNDEDFHSDEILETVVKQSEVLAHRKKWFYFVRSLLCSFKRLWKGCLNSPTYWRPQTEHSKM
jgi:hypothetical protein